MQVTQACEDAQQLDVRVYAVPDSGGRGRPRVLLDTTAVLCAARLPLLRAFVGMVDVDAVRDAVPASHLGRLASTLSVPLLQVCYTACHASEAARLPPPRKRLRRTLA